MEKRLRLLIVEDKPRHLAHVKKLLSERINAGAPIEPIYASSFDKAKQEVDSGNLDAILSDIFFPSGTGQDEENQAIKMYELSQENGLPLVYCTDGYHHDRLLEDTYQWVQEKTAWAAPEKRDKLLVGLVDVHARESPRIPVKNWPKAYFELMNRMGGIEVTEGSGWIKRGYQVGDVANSAAKSRDKSDLARKERGDLFSWYAEKGIKDIAFDYMGVPESYDPLIQLLEE